MTDLTFEAFTSLSQDVNKSRGKSPETEEGIVSEKYPELRLDMSNEEISKVTKKWQKSWEDSEVYQTWMKKSEEHENYWEGRQHSRPKTDTTRDLVDNVIFEALETYLPQITRRNPEPMISLKSGQPETPENQKFAKDLQKELADIADETNLRLKLKRAGRNWATNLLGVGKVVWDLDKDIPSLEIIRLKRIILDPKGTQSEDGYTGKFLGQHVDMQASKLIATLEAIDGEPEGIKYIKELVKEDLDTEVSFIEWWTPEYSCWTLKGEVLWKKKNPLWNYDMPYSDVETDPFGGETEVQKTQPGLNHLPSPRIPYIFLSVFNLGKQPIDETSLISQNLSNQDLINKRLAQIDKNADNINGGLIISGARSGLTEGQAKKAGQALRKGGMVWIPDGAPRDAVDRFVGQELPAEVYNQMVDTRARTRDIFGTSGSTPAGLENESTVRGKIINRTSDADRIGGGVSEYVEQFADQVFNWWIQLLYVNDQRFREMQVPKIVASVKEGSLLPKDSTTIANQAIELSSAGKMSTVDLYKRLDYPNPEELAANVWLEANAPELLFKDDQRVLQAIQMKQQSAAGAAQKPPSLSISFKDLPPAGQVQAAQQAGIQLDAEAIAAYDAQQAAQTAAAKAPPVVPGQETVPLDQPIQ